MFALKYLTGAELLTATQTWVDPAAEARRRLDAIDATRPLLVPLIAGRTAIQAALAAREPEGVENEGRGLDARHDVVGRGIFDVLTVSARLAANDARAAALIAMRDTIFPDGRRVFAASYGEEAGQVDARTDRVTPAIRAELAAITIEGRTLAAFFEELQTVAHALGGAVAQRAEEAARAGGPTPVGKLRAASNRVIRVIRAVGDAHADDATIELFFGPLRVAAESAQRRAIARNSGATPPTPSTPGADPGATPPRED